MHFTATGDAPTPLVPLHVPAAGGFDGYAGVDGEGEVVWYWRTWVCAPGMARSAGNGADNR